MSLVSVGFFSLLGNEQQLVKEEERSLVFGPLQAKRSFQDQLSVTDEVRALPVGQQTLDFLREAPNRTKMRKVKADRQIFKQNTEVFAADLTKNIQTDLRQKTHKIGLKHCSSGWQPFKQEFYFYKTTSTVAKALIYKNESTELKHMI